MKANILMQGGIIFVICLIGEWVAGMLPFVFPANVIAMILLFVLLLTKFLKEKDIREVGEFLRSNMAFFFIPAGVALMGEIDLLKGKVFSLLFICFVTMILTFMVSALTIRFVSRLQNKLRKGAKQ